MDLDQDIFLDMLEEELHDLESPYEFDSDEGFFMHFDVEDIDWVLDEQEQRKDIPYRPVSEKEARLATKAQYLSLWPEAVSKLYYRLTKAYRFSRDDALEQVVYAQDMLRNGAPVQVMVEEFLSEIKFQSMDELQPFITMLQDMANHTPLWILKGWTPHEIFKKYEKPNLKPLPDKPFEPFEPGLKGLSGGKAAPKVGRNDPCPCGSERKYKKCCGAPVLDGQDVPGTQSNKTGAPPPEVSPAPLKKEMPAREEPTLDERRALYEAADAFKKSKCWEWMYNDDLFGVMDPETKEIAYCCTMGWLGEFFGLGAYLGQEGLESVWGMMSSEEEDEPSPDLFFSQICLMASFEDRDGLADEDRAVIKELGLKFRGKNQWPLFRSYEPGLHPWFLSAWECRFLTLIMEQALEVALRCRKDKTILEHPDERTFFVRVPEEQEGELTWSDQYLEAARPAREFASFEITDQLRLKKFLNTPRKKKGYWEVDTFLLPFPAQEKKGERPYYPKILLVLDSSTGLILRYESVKNMQEEGHRFIEAVLQLVEGEESTLPSQIAVEREETYQLLSAACQQLKLPLVKVKSLQVMPEIREELFTGDFEGDY